MAVSVEKHEGSSRCDTTTNATDEPVSEIPQPVRPKHSVFTVGQKRLIVLAASTAALMSPMASNIYLPVLNILSHDLHVSDSDINFSITTYLILQGIAPTFIGGFSDNGGRRLSYLIAFVLFIAANIGLALQDNYAALMVLRSLQSAGSSGTVALATAVVADVVTSAERGAYVGYTSVAIILGPSISPVVGGLLGQYLSWRSVFWFLAIFGAVEFILFLLFFPETCRKIVGDGSIPPPRINYNLLNFVKERRLAKSGTPLDFTERDKLAADRVLRFPNPLATLVVISDKATALILLNNALLLCSYYSISTSIPSQFQRIYGFSTLQISLIYLPIALGGILSAFTTGRIVDWNYRRHARLLGRPVDRSRQDDLSEFPIEKVRIQVALPFAYLGCAGMIAWGWSIEHHVNLAVPCILVFIIGYTLIASSNCVSILLVDCYPGRPAAATAANNLVRCLLGAGGTAAVLPLINAIGLGWTNTFFALLWCSSTPFLWALMHYGPKWRAQRKQREETRASRAAKGKGGQEKDTVQISEAQADITDAGNQGEGKNASARVDIQAESVASASSIQASEEQSLHERQEKTAETTMEKRLGDKKP